MRKENRMYYFSVEGDTERWYLEWLQKAINAEPSAKYHAKFDVKIQKDPLARVKDISILGKTEIIHVFDRESEEPIHEERFQKTLDLMKQAQRAGKQITYRLGYTNFAFELWIILHKADCSGMMANRYQYLAPLNRAYGENFKSLDQYKHEDNFKRVLKKLTIADVREAIRRANKIMKHNEEAGYVQQQYKGYKYYKENPALSIGEQIEKIMRTCGLM